MKIVKLLLVFTLVSTIAVSCKESKKEEVQDDAVEMTEDATDSGMEATEDAAASTEEESSHDAAAGAAATGAAGAAAASSDGEGNMEAVEAVEAEAKELEPVVVPEGVIAEELADTPVIYPGCTGTVEEIRACNKESFIAYLRSEFKHDNVASEAGIKRGDYQIGVVMHVNKAGRVFSLRVTAPHEALQNEMIRVVNSTPKVVPATEAGQPVGVSLKFNVDFRVEATQ
ncbi:hypothetical protein QWY87_04160 [Lutimonas halocynthiae]|uniref:hypothetical protein n=1 Tax=Lutimonas halocynthiae TaxID=1446477 RepID=UPI0025B2A650|nr:hypothetical protein [Lutimonas halocynthiae]MDN3641880.1 hypothetical protein [Lutimonas halocynthiae]